MRERVAWMAAVLAAGLAGAGITWAVMRGPAAEPPLPPGLAASPAFSRFLTVYGDIRHEAIWPNTPTSLLDGAIQGMVASLSDPFSVYLTPKAAQALNQELDSTLSGIGVALDETAAGHFVILQVFPGTPAAHAGLRPDDQILAVDGRTVAGETADAVAAAIRGPAGTAVTLTVSRGGVERTVTVHRATIQVPTVFPRMLPGHVGYLAVTEFGYRTGGEVLAAVRQLDQEGARAYVVDLRNNPGGSLAECLQAVSAFVPPGPVVRLEYKEASLDRTYDSTGPGTTRPVAVLVNQDTASAAEIFAAAVAQRHVGILVGTRTYGKGIVQQLIPLSGGASLKLTVAKYLTPDGSDIEHRGLVPNLVVPEPKTAVPGVVGQDPQLDRALAWIQGRLDRAGH
ncbi:MAG: S41 family peptidase [Actinomycetia bacterium]|nr:S41 family peptidase [Actinomycetes bacterium]